MRFSQAIDVYARAATSLCAAADEDNDDDQQVGSAVVQKKKMVGPSGPLGATTVNKDKKKEGDLNFAFESARTAVRGASAECVDRQSNVAS